MVSTSEGFTAEFLYNDGHVGEINNLAKSLRLFIRCSSPAIQALKRLYPHAQFAYDPSTESGFYYDVDLGSG